MPDAAWMESQHKTFIAPGRLAMLAASERNPGDFFVLAGFPAVEVVTDADGSRRPRPVEVISINATPSVTPPSPIPPPSPASPYLDFWLPEGGMVRFNGGELTKGVSVPELQGASGGGWWYLDILHRPDGWTPARIRLAATHMGSKVTEVLQDGRRHKFCRGALIASHLDLIFKDYPELTEAFSSAVGQRPPADARVE